MPRHKPWTSTRKDESVSRQNWQNSPDWKTRRCSWACRITSSCGTYTAGKLTWPTNRPITTRSQKPPCTARNETTDRTRDRRLQTVLLLIPTLIADTKLIEE